MKNLTDVTVKEYVLIGGGHSHVGLIKMFAMNPLPGLRLTVLASDTHTPYSGMLPGFIAGQYSYDDVHLDLRPLAEFAQCRLYHSQVTSIDTQQRLVYSTNRPPIKYDILSINVGSTPNNFAISGVAEYTIPVKPVKQFIFQMDHIVHQSIHNEQFNTITVVGGGASGVELIMAIQHRVQLELQAHGQQKKSMSYRLMTADNIILPSHNPSVQKKVLNLFEQRGIELYLNAKISKISQDQDTNKIIEYAHDQKISSHAIVWCTTASSATWPKKSGLAVDENGFIEVNDYLQSVSHDNIFATGDIASMVNYPRPKSGVYAVRQGPPLFANIRRFALGQNLKAYKPQKNFLSLLNCADKTAIASRGPLALQGAWVWRYKDWIDTNFMKLFSHLPAMNNSNELAIDPAIIQADELKRLQEIPMRCGGCGAKVASNILTQVIRRLALMNNETHQNIILGVNQADDAAVIEVPEGQLLVQSLDYFKTFINDPFLLGKIATNHALGDLFAMGATPHSALALVTLPYSLSGILAEELFLIMSGALEVMSEHNMSLVGGHTGEGSDMSFGLNVNGFVAQNHLLSKAGLRAGELLILTKPLGTGALLAANMRYQAKGRWIDEAIEHMLHSNQAAANILQKFPIRSCTDITGFGLLGHLNEMLSVSQDTDSTDTKICAQIELSALPILTGCQHVMQQGIFSSLHEDNSLFASIIDNNKAYHKDPIYPLLFDPQTAGGLLFSVAQEHAQDCLQQLKKSGYQYASIIGRISENNVPQYGVSLS